MKRTIHVFFLLLFALNYSLAAELLVGAEQPDKYLPLLDGKKVALVVNQTSMVGEEHLLDFLLSKKVDVVKVFSPEHGFRGDADAGAEIADQVDRQTGIPVISLYGKNKKPTAAQLQNVDVLVFDIQDVGVRFYTYISTLQYVMEACAENERQLLVLDRPNPNGDYIAGPVLQKKFQSFVGMHAIPVVHGCTVGELAKMINGEGWLGANLQCLLTVVPVKNYTHKTLYSLPIKPSPNLPTDESIRLYSSLCFFEATNVSIGRGTRFPFQVIGYPDSTLGKFTFTPESIPGMATHPKQEGEKCYGIDLRDEPLCHQFSLKWLLDFYHQFEKEEDFLSSERWFNLLAGTDQLIHDIRDGKSLQEIEASWENDLQKYDCMRKNYLLYPDFDETP